MFFLVSFLVALAVTCLVVRSESRHAHLSNDNDLSGPQKFHSKAVPRIGGVGIFLGILSVLGLQAWLWREQNLEALLLIGCSLPAFLSGFVEDLTKRVSPAQRMFFTAVASLLAVWLLTAIIDHIDLPILRWLAIWPAEAVLLTVFTICGVTNSINLIDGFNGLASMCAMLIALGLAWLGYQLQDPLILGTALAAAGATLGFFVFNFPRGRIFLGDGGAYFLGFMLSELAVLLLHRHREVSPLFPLMLFAYPICETVFTIYRRRFVHRTSTGRPDAMHLHHLVYKRLTRRVFDRDDLPALTRRNSSTSPWLWLLCTAGVVPALLFWNSSVGLLAGLVTFVVLYLLLYRMLARFQIPRWLLAIAR